MSVVAPFRLLRHRDIDKAEWDRTLAACRLPLIYARSWYLDQMSPGWMALVSADGRIRMPVPVHRKWGWLHQVVTPPFVQQLGLFSPDPVTAIEVAAAIRLLRKHFLRIRLAFNEQNPQPALAGVRTMPGVNMLLDLHRPYTEIRQGYGDSLIKRLRRADTLHLDPDACTAEELVRYYRQHLQGKVMLTKDASRRWQGLLETAMHKGHGEILGVRGDDGKLLAANFFLKDAIRIYNVFGASSPEGRTRFAQHFLLDQVIRRHAGQPLDLDFEGSSLPGVAAFFRSFGSRTMNFYRIEAFGKPF